MRIGFLTPLYIPWTGGAEILLDRLTRTLQTRGHEVVVIAPRRRGTRASLPYPVVRTLRPFSKRFGLHHCLPNLLWAYLKHRFEILHCHGEYRAAYVARTFKKLTGVPFVVRALGGGFATVSDHPRLAPRVEKALAVADALIAQGEFLKDQMLDFGVQEEKITIIHNGVVPEEILISGECPRERPYLFYVGGLRPVKAYDVLLRAFAEIRDQIAPVQLVIAGSDQKLAEYEALRQELRLTDEEVVFVGNLDRAEMALHYQNALAYVCPFRQSPFSNANLEAMTAGLPIIATTVGGNPEQVRDDVEGILVPPEDSVALARAMRRVCLDRELCARYAAAARERARSFTWSRMVDQYETFYQQVLAGSGAG